MKNENSLIARINAAGAHLFTFTGIIYAFLSVLALIQNNPKMCIFWLVVSFVVDGVDGFWARKANVKKIYPYIDGVILDLFIDFITYCFIPALFIFQYIELPYGLKYFSIIVILISSTYWNCNINQKTKDHFFNGYLAGWNIILLYLYLFFDNTHFQHKPWFIFGIVMLFSFLTFVPKFKVIHPVRVEKFQPYNFIISGFWLLSALWLLWEHPNYNDANKYILLVTVLVLSTAYLLGVSLWRTFKKGLD